MNDKPDDLTSLYKERDAIVAALAANRKKPPHDLKTRLERYELQGKRATVEGTIESAKGRPREAIRWEKEAVEWSTLHEKTIREDQSKTLEQFADAIAGFMAQEKDAQALRDLAAYELPPGQTADTGETLWEPESGTTFEDYVKGINPATVFGPELAGTRPPEVVKGATLTAAPPPGDDDDDGPDSAPAAPSPA